MAISILAGPNFIAFLRREEYGQQIREEGPAGHHLKQGTPTMGGLLIVLSMIVPFLVLSRHTQAGLTVFFVFLACGAIGFADDFTKIRHRRSLGLSGRWAGDPGAMEGVPPFAAVGIDDDRVTACGRSGDCRGCVARCRAVHSNGDQLGNVSRHGEDVVEWFAGPRGVSCDGH